MPMVEPEANFSLVKVAALARYTPVRKQSILGIAPEALDAIDAVPPIGRLNALRIVTCSPRSFSVA